MDFNKAKELIGKVIQNDYKTDLHVIQSIRQIEPDWYNKSGYEFLIAEKWIDPKDLKNNYLHLDGTKLSI